MLLPLLTLYPPHAALCLGGVRSQHWLGWGYRGDQDGSDFGPKEAFDKHSGLGALFGTSMSGENQLGSHILLPLKELDLESTKRR